MQWKDDHKVNVAGVLIAFLLTRDLAQRHTTLVIYTPIDDDSISISTNFHIHVDEIVLSGKEAQRVLLRRAEYAKVIGIKEKLSSTL